MQKSLLSMMIAASLLLSSACQPPSNKPETVDTTQVQENASPALIEAKTPKELTTSIIELSEGKLRDELICNKLSDTIKIIDNKSKMEEIHAVQRQLKACLPTADNDVVLQWLEDYQAMYSRFLGVDDYNDDEAFYAIYDSLEQGKKATVAQLKQVNPRTRYLISLVESKADVSILYIGEGIFVFHHDLQAMADLFAPYLSSDQSEFVERMAEDNQNIFWNDAAVAVSFDEVIDRAIFWENYIQQYPDSYFIKDAQELFDLYRYVIFFGSDNTRWTDDAVTEFIEPNYKQAIQKLAKRSNSLLAQDALSLVEFMAMSEAKRQRSYPVPKVDDEGYEIQDWSKVRHQLQAALPLASPWGDNNKDCLSSVICIDY